MWCALLNLKENSCDHNGATTYGLVKKKKTHHFLDNLGALYLEGSKFWWSEIGDIAKYYLRNNEKTLKKRFGYNSALKDR